MRTRARRWMDISIGCFLAEAAVFAAVIPVYLKMGQHALLYAAPIASLVMCFVFGLLVGRREESRPVMSGALVGLVAALLYVALTLFRPEPLAYLLAHVLKVLGGAAGGAVGGSRRAMPHTTGLEAG
jgi:putative membrane protein (TIGR04086 family)